jgi:hypothetical protein
VQETLQKLFRPRPLFKINNCLSPTVKRGGWKKYPESEDSLIRRHYYYYYYHYHHRRRRRPSYHLYAGYLQLYT